MTVKLADIAGQVTTTTGTGTITLGIPVVGFVSFAQAGLVSGDQFYYVINTDLIDGIPQKREVGKGTFTVNEGVVTLSRDQVVRSTEDDNSRVHLNGDSQVYATVVADFFSPRYYDLAVATANWVRETETDPWIATKTLNGIFDFDRPIVDLNLSQVTDRLLISDIQREWAKVYRVEASADNTLKFYAYSLPITDFELQIGVV